MNRGLAALLVMVGVVAVVVIILISNTIPVTISINVGETKSVTLDGTEFTFEAVMGYQDSVPHHIVVFWNTKDHSDHGTVDAYYEGWTQLTSWSGHRMEITFTNITTNSVTFTVTVTRTS